MAFTGNFMCTSFKKELLEGVHNFKNSGGSTFNLAMYTNSASFTAATTAYTASNEVSGTGYTAKGASLTRVDPSTSGTTALTDFADLTFSTATVTARGALIFNDSASGDPTVVVLDFGADKTSTAGDFTIVFPTADASSAIIRIA
jgi:PKD repeat protein